MMALCAGGKACGAHLVHVSQPHLDRATAVLDAGNWRGARASIVARYLAPGMFQHLEMEASSRRLTNQGSAVLCHGAPAK